MGNYKLMIFHKKKMKNNNKIFKNFIFKYKKQHHKLKYNVKQILYNMQKLIYKLFNTKNNNNLLYKIKLKLINQYNNKILIKI